MDATAIGRRCGPLDSERVVGNPYLIALRQSCPSFDQNRADNQSEP
jgi:hypothetical protein